MLNNTGTFKSCGFRKVLFLKLAEAEEEGEGIVDAKARVMIVLIKITLMMEMQPFTTILDTIIILTITRVSTITLR